jgi:integrase
VLNLESVLSLPPGTLIGRLDTQSYFAPKRTRSCQTDFGRRMSKIRLSAERVRIQPTPRLRAQWLELLRFKMDVLRPEATARNIWRGKPPHRTGTKPDWSMMVDGRVCTSAGHAWSGISGFLGWLTLPKPGGEGMTIEQADTLAWMLDAERVLKHIAWKVARADGVFNNGPLGLLRDICSHLRPQTGFLWKTTSLAASLPREFMLAGRALHALDADALCAAWQEACKLARDALLSRVKAVTSSGQVHMSRNPKEAIQSILSDAHSLRVVLEMVRTMEHSPPPKHQSRVFNSWLRDLLLIKMLCTNPLRVSQFAVMTYRVDNSGNLYQTNQGEWRLRYKGIDFKNERGAARDDYDVSVPRSLWPTIQRYLSEARPHLHGADACDYVFLPTVSNQSDVDKYGDPKVDRHGMWNAEAISGRVYELTAKYLPGVPPFHGHAMRHIVATDYLKRVPGDYPTVARLLHDKLITVLKAYAHYEVDASLRRLHMYVESIWSEARSRTGHMTFDQSSPEPFPDMRVFKAKGK